MSKTLRALALVLVLAMAFVACGDDGADTDSGSGSGSASEPADEKDPQAADNAEYCNTYVEAQAAVIGVSSGDDPGAVPPLLDKLEETAPEEVADTLGEFVPQIREALETQDDSVFGSDEFSAADEELDTYVAENCGFESYDVSAVDYAFDGIPESFAAGNVTFNWSNDGEEVHEILIVKKLDESLTAEDLLKMSDKEAQTKIQFINASFGPPGTTDTETMPFDAGSYIAVCFVPVGATDMQSMDKADGPPHAKKGMITEFSVN